jgi:hypothetical protein
MGTPGYRSCITNIYTCSDTIEYTPDINIITSGGVCMSEAYISADSVEYIPYIDLNTQVSNNTEYRTCLLDTGIEAIDCGSEVNINTQGYNSSIIKSYISSDVVECIPDNNTNGKSVQGYRNCSKKSYSCSDTIDCVPDININTQGSTGPTGPCGSYVIPNELSFNKLYFPYSISNPPTTSTIQIYGTGGTGSFIKMYDHDAPNNPIFNLINQNDGTNDYALLSMGNGNNTQKIFMDGNIGEIKTNTITGTSGSFEYLSTKIIGNSNQIDDITIYGSTSGNSNLFTNVTGGSINIGNTDHTGILTINGVPKITAINVRNNGISSLISPTGIFNSGEYSFNTTSTMPIVTTSRNIVISNASLLNPIPSSSGINNIAIGYGTLGKNTSGVQNVAIGNGVLGEHLGSNATAVGHGALQTATSNNTAFGSIAGNRITTGNNNSIMGFAAFSNATISSNNIAIGVNAGNAVTSAFHSNCSFLGSNSNSNNVGHSNSVALGANSVIRGNNQIVLGQEPFPAGVILPSRQTLGLASPITSNTNISTSSTFNIVTINNGTLGVAGTILTTSESPPLLIGMFISVASIFSGVTITGFNSPNSWTISSSQLVTSPATGTYNLPTYPLYITSISGNIMTISTSTYSLNLPINTRIFGEGISDGTVIESGSGTSYTLNNSFTLQAITGGYNSPFISINFPLSDVYYITPLPNATDVITIRLPNIVSVNIGAKATFRIVSKADGRVVLASNVENIFTGTSHTPTTNGLHTIYSGNSNNLSTHTFVCLPTSIGIPAFQYAWFEL